MEVLPLYKEITHLNLQQNLFTSVSSRIVMLSPFLEEINLSSNQISAFSINFTGLNCLKVLNLSDNKIDGYLESIGQLGKLKDLNLSKNNITNFNLNELPNLVKLNLSFNSFENFPDLT